VRQRPRPRGPARRDPQGLHPVQTHLVQRAPARPPIGKRGTRSFAWRQKRGQPAPTPRTAHGAQARTWRINGGLAERTICLDLLASSSVCTLPCTHISTRRASRGCGRLASAKCPPCAAWSCRRGLRSCTKGVECFDQGTAGGLDSVVHGGRPGIYRRSVQPRARPYPPSRH
jgi:hypothetical protein